MAHEGQGDELLIEFWTKSEGTDATGKHTETRVTLCVTLFHECQVGE